MNDLAFAGVGTVEVNGVALAYRERGEGEPVVFVHGGASDLRTWEHQLSAIAASHRAIGIMHEDNPQAVNEAILAFLGGFASEAGTEPRR